MRRIPRLTTASLLAVAGLVAAGCTSTTSPPTPTGPPPSTAAAPSPATSSAVTPAPSPTPTWPTALTEVDAMGAADSYTVVWLATTGDAPDDVFGPIIDRTTALGYSVATTPVTCVAEAPPELVDGDDPGAVMGLPVYFATRAEADTFVDLWGEHVTAVVDDVHLACDWG